MVIFLIKHGCFFISAFSQHINELSIIIDPEGMNFQVQKTHLSTVKVGVILIRYLIKGKLSLAADCYCYAQSCLWLTVISGA